MTRTFLPAALLALATALPVQAEQFAVRLEAAYGGANDRLKDALRITEIDRVSDGAAHYVILDAPDEGYVEAFFYAIGQEPVALHALEADWTVPAMKALSLSQRLGFLRAIACDFCTS